jgi:hypothetical protein
VIKTIKKSIELDRDKSHTHSKTTRTSISPTRRPSFARYAVEEFKLKGFLKPVIAFNVVGLMP